MSNETAQSEFDRLDTEYRSYISKMRARWLSDNPETSREVYEVRSRKEQDEAYSRLAQLNRYVTQLAEAWWSERGYCVVWPDDNSKPMQVYKLETT